MIMTKKNVHDIERMGVSKKFPTIKAFLKFYQLGGLEGWEDDVLVRLQRYAKDGAGFVFKYGPNTGDDTYRFFSATMPAS